jgi:hypothetical protein
MNRQEIIQKLINHIDAKSYLEIGLGNGEVHKNINCRIKVGVDPCEYPITKEHNVQPTFKLTSDEFFNQNKETFDIIFIDGLHEAACVERDINNSLKILNTKGYIICHDMNPKNEAAQLVPRIRKLWNGDCWKAWVKVRSTNPNLKMFVVNTDFGCGVIQKGSQELLDLNNLDLTYKNFKKHKKEWLNLISVKEFLSINLENEEFF